MLLASSLVTSALVSGCSRPSESTAPTTEPSPTPPTPPEPPPMPTLTTPPSDEVCAQVIVVQWQGAPGAPESITRTEGEARQRAEELLQRIESGAATFEDVATNESDARASGSRGGLLGTYSRGDFPPQHQAIRDRAFAMQVSETTEVLQAPYGWVILHRCPVVYRRTRHILVRFQGARNAPAEVTRSRDEARARAEELRARVIAPGADFGAVARESSEDASAERGGDLGWLGRGRLAPAYETAVEQLAVSDVSPVVETEFGFHVIQRLQ